MKHDPQPAHAPLLTREELAARWQVSCMTLHRWRMDGRLPSYKLGRSVRFSLADVERLEREARVSHPPVIDVVATTIT